MTTISKLTLIAQNIKRPKGRIPKRTKDWLIVNEPDDVLFASVASGMIEWIDSPRIIRK